MLGAGVPIVSITDGRSALVTTKTVGKVRHFSERMAEVGLQAATRRSRLLCRRYWRQCKASARRQRRLRRAPAATNRRPRLVVARSDYRHKTANLPTNDCFSVDHVIRFRAPRLLAGVAQPPRTITDRKTSLRAADVGPRRYTAARS